MTMSRLVPTCLLAAALACGPGPILVDFTSDGVADASESEAGPSDASESGSLDTGESSTSETGESGTGETSESTSTSETGESTSTSETDESTSTSETESGSETGELPYDCDALVQPYVELRELDAPRAFHDVAFDDTGHLIGWDGFSAFMSAPYGGAASLLLPGVTFVDGMDVLANGDIVYAAGSELRRLADNLQVTVEASGFVGAYGVTVGPDQRVYVGASDAVYRVDLELGQTEFFVALPGNINTRATVFNLDSTRMYIATLSSGDVYVVELDIDLEPVGVPSVFASGVGSSWHDGIGMDACGNLYVPEYFTGGLYRIDPQGVVTPLYMNDSVGYGHGLEWGSGVGGWRDDALYLPQPYDANTVRELVLGVPSAATVRTWAGG